MRASERLAPEGRAANHAEDGGRAERRALLPRGGRAAQRRAAHRRGGAVRGLQRVRAAVQRAVQVQHGAEDVPDQQEQRVRRGAEGGAAGERV